MTGTPENTAPPASEEEPPHYLVQRVREALAHDERVAELEVKVKVYGRRVFLTGDVATQERRDAIDEMLAELLPDHDVVNETRAPSLEEPTQVETLP
ncbi:MAG: BON domain-containing protein [Actinomycetota bacterium]